VRPLANFGVAVVSGRALPHVVFAGDENHLVGYAGLPQALNPYLKELRRDASRRRRRAADARHLRHRVRHALRRVGGTLPFRFWKKRHHAAEDQGRLGEHGLVVVAIADGGAGVDPRSISATVDGHTARTHFANGKLTFRAEPGSREIVVTASDYQELKNMEGRHEDQAEHGHADAHRRGRLTARLVLVDRRQRREVALDRTREIVVGSFSTTRSARLPRARLRSAPHLTDLRESRPFSSRQQDDRRDEQDDRKPTHDPRILTP
jgi:hypothetical protein